MLERIWNVGRSLFFAAVFVSLQVWYLPRWVGLRGSLRAPFDDSLRWAGLVFMLPGAVIMLSCVLNFGTAGRGTPAPFDPPRRLVRRDFYLYVRNPMYVGMALFLIGEAVMFAKFRWGLLIYAAVVAAVTHAFVVLYEEPTLRRKFGPDYEQYCATVPRWLPRLPRPGQVVGQPR
jgi:protein-S-isoprenylcysteine O-methyltransferase Ste14